MSFFSNKRSFQQKIIFNTIQVLETKFTTKFYFLKKVLEISLKNYNKKQKLCKFFKI